MLRSTNIQKYLATIKRCDKKERDPTSLSYLIPRTISQSACIRLGNVLEDVLNLYLEERLEGYTRNNQQKNTKGERQKDILFQKDKVVLYGEIKANINLDTQKSKATVESIQKVHQEYISAGCVPTSYLVCLRYLRTADVPPTIAKKYTGVRLIGLSDFLTDVLHHVPDELASYETYSEVLGTLVDCIE